MKASIIGAAVALAFTATLPAHAQGANANASVKASNQQAGEAFPNDRTAGQDKGKPETVKKVEKSRPVQATKNVASDAGHAVSNTAKKGANATRHLGETINSKLPQTQNNTSISGNAGTDVKTDTRK
ncbi:hypothetical protein [Ramlibacter humi]|uniref:Uncharacterized protein n=1 Tax=Ramlibacter humi TaxID=2530451 RepID=A0A4Z0BYN9_9BURK|nr:hypothetical protein [Ramlibacter humi]TFZ03802.1 hypothetical protein EZ216_09110 [Ramlibacter humi]